MFYAHKMWVIYQFDDLFSYSLNCRSDVNVEEDCVKVHSLYARFRIYYL